MLIDPKYKMSGFDLTCLRVIHMTDVILIWHRIPDSVVVWKSNKMELWYDVTWTSSVAQGGL